MGTYRCLLLLWRLCSSCTVLAGSFLGSFVETEEVFSHLARELLVIFAFACSQQCEVYVDLYFGAFCGFLLRGLASRLLVDGGKSVALAKGHLRLVLENPLFLVEQDVSFLGEHKEFVSLLDDRDLLIVKLDPFSGVAVLDEAVVVTTASRVAVVDDHGVKLVGVPALDDWGLEAGQQRRHRLGVEGCLLLVAVDLFVGQLSVQVVLVEGEREWELHVVR